MGSGAYFAQGTVIRSGADSITVENNSYVLENSVVLGNAEFPAHIQSKTVFGHRSLIIGAAVGNLCEIGNGCIIMPGAVIGDMCILGEGTLVSAGMELPDCSVAVGRPGRIIRSLTKADKAMIQRMRNNDLTLSPYQAIMMELAESRGYNGTASCV